MQISTPDLRQLTDQAKKLFGEMSGAEDVVQSGLDYSLDKHWRFGKLLNQLKKAVPHGDWEKWRGDTFPGLEERKAQVCQMLDRLNPKAKNSSDLTAESVRKFRFGYVPVKSRPKLEGDKKFARPSHHGSVVNECNKLAQRIDAKQYAPDLRELKRDFIPFYKWLQVLYGDA